MDLNSSDINRVSELDSDTGVQKWFRQILVSISVLPPEAWILDIVQACLAPIKHIIQASCES